MTSKAFIDKNLNAISELFPQVQLRYEYKIHTRTHVIEVIPISFFEGNEEYMNIESEFECEFERMFPKEGILFISENSLTEISAIK